MQSSVLQCAARNGRHGPIMEPRVRPVASRPAPSVREADVSCCCPPPSTSTPPFLRHASPPHPTPRPPHLLPHACSALNHAAFLGQECFGCTFLSCSAWVPSPRPCRHLRRCSSLLVRRPPYKTAHLHPPTPHATPHRVTLQVPSSTACSSACSALWARPASWCLLPSLRRLWCTSRRWCPKPRAARCRRCRDCWQYPSLTAAATGLGHRVGWAWGLGGQWAAGMPLPWAAPLVTRQRRVLPRPLPR